MCDSERCQLRNIASGSMRQAEFEAQSSLLNKKAEELSLLRKYNINMMWRKMKDKSGASSEVPSEEAIQHYTALFNEEDEDSLNIKSIIIFFLKFT